MSVRVAINGYGRIGRMTLRAIYEMGRNKDVEIVAINSLGSPETNVHLTKFDSTHGRFNSEISFANDHLIIDGDEIFVFSERNPKAIPWGEHEIDVVLECSGKFNQRDKAAMHLESGAKKVLISAPAGKDVDATVVYGINHDIVQSHHQVVSNASCTTNCLAPMLKPLHERVGVVTGFMTTIHAYTNDQVLTDAYHNDLRRARSATQSMIPTKTGAAKSIGLIFPELDGKLDGFAMRVPTTNVSVVDLTFVAKRKTNEEEVNQCLREAAEGALKEVVEINELPLVSCDFNHHPASSIFDLTQTKVIDNVVKVVAWYDNEWGFSNRMIDMAVLLGSM